MFHLSLSLSLSLCVSLDTEDDDVETNYDSIRTVVSFSRCTFRTYVRSGTIVLSHEMIYYYSTR